jgi:hypothetical protein
LKPALLTAADLFFDCSLKDGLNLVPFEYVRSFYCFLFIVCCTRLVSEEADEPDSILWSPAIIPKKQK